MNRLEKEFVAYLSHPSAIREVILEMQKGLTSSNSDLVFRNPFSDSTVEGDLENLERRGGLKFNEDSEYARKITEQSLRKILSSEGFVSVIDKKDSLGNDIETVYAMLFDKLIFTICLNEPYRDHPWVTYHTEKVFSSAKEFEESFRGHVLMLRGERAGTISEKAKWIRSLLDMRPREIKENFSMYLAHATRAMEMTRKFELDFEGKNEDIELVNPFYDLEGGEKDRVIEDARKRGEKLILPEGFDKEVIMKDVGAIENTNGCLLIIDDFSIGREMELVYANLLRSNPIVAVCAPKLADHPMIKFHTDYVFTSYQECFEKLPGIVADVRRGAVNKRLEDYHEWLGVMLKEKL